MTSSSVSEPDSSYRVESGSLLHVFILTHTRPFGYLVSDPFTKGLRGFTRYLLVCFTWNNHLVSAKQKEDLDVFEVPLTGNTVRCICR